MKDGLERLVNRGEYDRFRQETTEGIHSINTLKYTIDENTGFINVETFFTGIEASPELNKIHDLRDGARPFQQPVIPLNGSGRRRSSMGMRLF